jgi:hypothetical protein
MDVHAADQETLRDRSQIFLDLGITLFCGGKLLPPLRKGMRRSGDQSEPVPKRLVRDCATKVAELGSRFGNGAADLGSDFDLTSQKFRRDLFAKEATAGAHESFGRVASKIAGLQVDKEIFLFDPDGERRIIRHALKQSWLGDEGQRDSRSPKP